MNKTHTLLSTNSRVSFMLKAFQTRERFISLF